MLKRMIRRYTRAEYVARTGRLRAARPGMTLSTDVIVGFSGETDDDFEATLSLVREVGFTSLFGFKYSPRPLTPALKLPDDVPEEKKSERLARLFETAEELTRTHLATLVGTRQRVLIEGASKTGDRVEGRTERNEIVHVAARSDVEMIGAVVEVEILRARTSTPSKGWSPRWRSPRPTARWRRPRGPRRRPRRALPVLAASEGH